MARRLTGTAQDVVRRHAGPQGLDRTTFRAMQREGRRANVATM